MPVPLSSRRRTTVTERLVSGERRVIPARYQSIEATRKIAKANGIASGPLK